jgi:aryl-alcohol dehydrogenase-like predicted oxidoreductase
MVQTKPKFLTNEILSNAFHHFLREHGVHTYQYQETAQGLLNRKAHYGRVNISRRSNLAQDFEKWLFEQGASVRQIERHWFAEFGDPAQATWFALKYS